MIRELKQISKCSFQDSRTTCINYELIHEPDFRNIKCSTKLFIRQIQLVLGVLQVGV